MHTYLRLVLDRFDCYGTWLPGTRVYVGEIGKLVGGGSFSHTGDIGERTGEAPPAIIPVDEPPQQAMAGATASRSGGVSVKAGEILDALTDASASVTMRMAKRNSAALLLEQVTRRQFGDERIIRRLMETMLQKGLIDLDEVVVTYVLEAKSGIVATSSERELAGDATVEAGVGFSEFKLGKVRGRLAIVSGESSDTIAVAERNRPLTPMYRVLFFRGSRPWWHFWKKVYSVEALIEASTSLRASRGIRATLAPPQEATGAVSGSSRPSLALAEQALMQLSGAEVPVLGYTPAAAGSLPRVEGVSVVGAEMVGLHKDMGAILHARGDLEGAERHLQTAMELANAVYGVAAPELTPVSARRAPRRGRRSRRAEEARTPATR
ncbi:MAG TPA: hypothetical protein VF250_07665 [Conexibacter sp.]